MKRHQPTEIKCQTENPEVIKLLSSTGPCISKNKALQVLGLVDSEIIHSFTMSSELNIKATSKFRPHQLLDHHHVLLFQHVTEAAVLTAIAPASAVSI